MMAHEAVFTFRPTLRARVGMATLIVAILAHQVGMKRTGAALYMRVVRDFDHNFARWYRISECRS